MKKGDDAFNARDFKAVDTVHHPDMVAHITGLPAPVYGSKAHSAAIAQMVAAFPDMSVTATRTRLNWEVATGSPWSPTSPERSPAK